MHQPIVTRHLRTRRQPGGGRCLVEYVVHDLPASEATWRLNARRIAAEVNAENLFGGTIDWTMVSLLARELLTPPAPADDGAPQ
jgi:hypothetical protein